MLLILKKINLENLRGSLVRIFARFPVSAAISLAAFVLIVVYIRLVDSFSQTQVEVILKTFITLLLALVFSVAVYLLAESRQAQGRKKNYYQVLTLVFAWLFYYFFEEQLFTSERVETVVYIALTALGVAAFLFVAGFFRKVLVQPESQEEFYASTYALVLKILMAGIVGGAAALLGFAALAALFTLFDITSLETANWFGYWAAFSGLVLAPFFLLATLPAQEGVRETFVTEITANRFYFFLVNYIGLPAIFIYFVILYAYTVKVLANFSDWPQGEVAWMVILFSFFGYLIYFASYVFTQASGTPGLFRKIFPWAALLQTPMLFYAIGLRINQYDLTINRYLVLVFGLWLVFLSGYYILSRRKDLSMPFFSLLVVVIVMSIGPWSVYVLPEYRQQERLRDNLIQAGMLQDGEIHPPESYQDVDARLSGDIYGGIEYLCDFHGCESLEGIFSAKLSEIRQADKQEFLDRQARRVEELQIAKASQERIQEARSEEYRGIRSYDLVRELAEYLKVERWSRSAAGSWEEPEYLRFENELRHDFDASIRVSGYDHYVPLRVGKSARLQFLERQEESGRNQAGGWFAIVDGDLAELVLYQGEEVAERISIQGNIVQKILDSKEDYIQPEHNERWLTAFLPPEKMSFPIRGEAYDIKVVLMSISIKNPDWPGEDQPSDSDGISPQRSIASPVDGYVLVRERDEKAEIVGRKTYHNADIGISFDYPAELRLTTSAGLADLDSGQQRTARVFAGRDAVFTLSAYSADFHPEVYEGTQTFYSAEPIDTGLSKDRIAEEFEFLQPFNIQYINVDGRQAISFYGVPSYAWLAASKFVVIPNPDNEFTNIVIAGPFLVFKQNLDSRSQENIDEVKRSVSSGEYLSDAKIKKQQQQFENMLETVEF